MSVLRILLVTLFLATCPRGTAQAQQNPRFTWDNTGGAVMIGAFSDGLGLHTEPPGEWPNPDIGYAVDIFVNGVHDLSYFNLWVVSPATRISAIRFRGIPASSAIVKPRVFLNVNVNGQGTIPFIGGAQRWTVGAIEETNNAVVVLKMTSVQVGESLSNPGAFDVNSFGAINVYRDPNLTGYTGEVFASLVANGTPNGDGTSRYSGDVESFRSDSGFLGSLVATNGSIGSITVGQNLGTHERPVFVSARNGIASVVAGAIEGTIIANNGGTGSLHDLRTTSGSMIGRLDFETFSTSGAGPGIFITGGNLDADVKINSGLTRDANASITVTGDGQTTGLLPANRTISIARGLYGALNFPANGLQGQVIINASGAVDANGVPLNPWGAAATPPADGPVTVGSGAGAITLQRADAHGTPYYDVASSAVGGGAVGLVPYKLYASDCVPPHHEDWLTPGGEALFLDSQLNGTIPNTPAIPVRMRFYGPVKTDAPSNATPVAVWLWLDDSGGNPARWFDMTPAFDITVNRADSTSREIALARAAGHGTLPPGYYAVTVDRTSPNKLYCDGTTASAPPAVGTNMVNPQNLPVTEYHFTLFPDCNSNATWDAVDIANGEDDQDGNGIPDACVVAAAHCPADLDDGEFGGVPDNGVDVSDLVFFLYGYENGIAVVDLDDGSMTGIPDAGVDINDLLYFLAHYESGC